MNANVQLKPLDNDILNKLNLEPDFISYLKENGTFDEISKLAGEAATVDPMLRGRNIKLIQKIIKRGRIGEEINKDLERDLENESPYIQIKNCTENNLKDVTANIPVRCFVAVTGVSGSGKSTLINDILSNYLMNYFYDSRLPVGKHGEILGLENIDKAIIIDQSPIGRTPRSNPATYTKLFDPIRILFSELPESKARGYLQGRFSFNVPGGRCESCEGDGMLKVEMKFLPDVYVTCEDCAGQRYNRETLDIKYKDKSIADILAMSVEEALPFFENHVTVKRRLSTMHSVGLDYIKLGQPATTLSGGEAQRIKLSTELSKIGTGNTLYILDEPTTGLHPLDVKMLLEVLHKLVDKGNTVLVIEHNLDVIKTADWLIDLGPEGGDKGGKIIATGTPEQVAKSKVSYTGKYLAKMLAK
jgi:excinuclease ABC subunit A